MGDLEFIQEKVLAGDYFQVSGNINSIGNIIEFIVPNGKIAFLIEAKLVMSSIINLPLPNISNLDITVKNEVVAELKIDGVTKDTTHVGINSRAATFNGAESSSNNTYGDTGDGRFNVLGVSLVGNGVKKITIENTIDNGTAFASMSGYLV